MSTKIVELFIEDMEDESGIEAISLVSKPAHEENWMAFKEEEVETFNPYKVMPDDFCATNKLLFELGEPYEKLLEEGWEILRVEKITPQVIEKMNKDRFTQSNPNEDSDFDRENFRVRFKYIGPRNAGRQFCAEMLSANRVYTIEDINALSDGVANPDFGFYEIFTWRGSYNCRHLWVRLIYKKQGTIVNSASSRRGLIEEQGLGPVLQPDTRTTATIEAANRGTRADGSPIQQWKPGVAREGKVFSKVEFAGEKISLDYDDTLSTEQGKEIAQSLIEDGNEVYIISAREDKSPMMKIADELGIPASRVYATGSNKAKIEKVKSLEIKKHIDNNEDVIKELGDVGVKFSDFGLEDACWEGYEPYGTKILDGREVPNCVPVEQAEQMEREEFRTYNDYPESAKNNACKALKWRDEHGDEVKGMTRVGWTRANQLCKGENISEETIARMSGFQRHKKNSEVAPDLKDTPWKDAGHVAWLGWGGTTGVNWASSKLESIRNGKMSTQKLYFLDDEKKVIVGAAMVPNKMIHRYDALGNLYYVFFSKATIKKMADKFLRQKRTDETSVEHDGRKLGADKVYITESWVSEDPIKDKSAIYGFNLPAGTWFVEMKVLDDKVWKQIKSGELNGFSVEGLFAEKSYFSSKSDIINNIKEILKSITDE